MAHDLYICYSNRDKGAAGAVCAALEARGLRCWIAPRDVLPGMAWADAVLDAIAQSRLVVLIFSSGANDSSHVKREIERVIRAGIPVIPLRIEDVVPSKTFDYFLGSGHWLNAVTPPIESHLQELVEAAHRNLFPKQATKESGPPENQTDGFTKAGNYDAFISYRRESGASEARAIRAELRQQKLRVFLDVDDLRSGHFDEALLARIADAPNFIVILSPNCLDRCADEQDWLRKEIAQAIKTSRNIIPIMMGGFSFPERHTLPEELKALPTHNGLEYSHKYFNAMIAEILRYLRTENLPGPIVANAESAPRDSVGKLAVIPQTPKATTQPPKQPATVTAGGSVDKVGEKALALLGVLGVAALRAVIAGLLGYKFAAPLVGFVIAWVKNLPNNEYQTLIEDLRYYCGFGLMAIVFVATLMEKASKK